LHLSGSEYFGLFSPTVGMVAVQNSKHCGNDVRALRLAAEMSVMVRRPFEGGKMLDELKEEAIVNKVGVFPL
jgi:hypothetical protein